MKRSSGVLLPVASLPSKYGIGCFDRCAYDFVDQLVKAGQSYWQILPMGPTGYGDSPYQAFSTFAGNPYFISPDDLVKKGYLTENDCIRAAEGTSGKEVPVQQPGQILIFRCAGFAPPAPNRPLETDAGRFFLQYGLRTGCLDRQKS